MLPVMDLQSAQPLSLTLTLCLDKQAVIHPSLDVVLSSVPFIVCTPAIFPEFFFSCPDFLRMKFNL